MPIFRIMGGSRNNAAAAANNTSNLTQQQPQANQQQRVSRHTYPGQRLNRSLPNQNNTSSSVPVVQNNNTTQPQNYRPPTSSAPPRTSTSTNPANSTNRVVQGLAPEQQLLLNLQAVGETTRPGSYSVTRTTTGPAQVFRVTVPPGVRPGSEFTVHAGARRVRVRCPQTSRPGHSLQITLPPEPVKITILAWEK